MTWITAFCVVVTFYAHTLLNMSSSITTPIITIVVAVGLSIMSLLGVLTMRMLSAGTPARKISASLMYVAMWLALVSTLSGATQRSMSPSDWGVFVIETMTSLLLTLSNNRVGLLKDICRLAVVFAFADLTVNSLSFFGVADLAKHVGAAGTEYGLHYLGIPNSSFAEGIVAFVAIAYVASGVPYSRAFEMMVRIIIIAALFASEMMIRARSDFGISVVAVLLLLVRRSHRIPLILVSLMISAMLLYATFVHSPYNGDETLRADLIASGFQRALHHPFLGEGIRYRDTTDLIANFQSLHAAGVTESGTLDFAIAYGLPSTICLYLSTFFAMAARRNFQTLPSVLLACMLGALAINGALLPFFGSVTFYLALIICQREEPWILLPRERPI